MIKSGEEDKKKIYRALCTINHNVTLELLEKLQISNEFVIQQWTPLRVLHRRTLMKRPRTIFSVKSHAIKGKKVCQRLKGKKNLRTKSVTGKGKVWG